MSKRTYPSIDAQLRVIMRWLIKFGGRRPSEAAMEATAMSDARRRKLFAALRDTGCIAPGPDGWDAVKEGGQS